MKKWQVAVRLISFSLIFFVLLLIVSNIFMDKYYANGGHLQYYFQGQQGIKAEEKESIDVAFVGTSHSGCAFSPMDIWESSGIPTYNLTSSGQPLWIAYYHFQELLKRQTPKVLILDVYSVFMPNEEKGIIGAADNTSFFLQPSIEKLFAIAEQREQMKKYSEFHKNEYNKSFSDYFSISINHARWKNGTLGKRDFDYLKNKPLSTLKGFIPLYETFDMTGKELVLDAGGNGKISDVDKEYLDKILKLCEKNNVKLVFSIIPYEDSLVNKPLNDIKNYAEKNNIDIWDMFQSIDSLNIDMATDFNDSGHFNILGAKKASVWVGNKLRESYGLEDKRDNPSYAKWNELLSTYNNYENNFNFKNVSDVEELLSKASTGEYLIIAQANMAIEELTQLKELEIFNKYGLMQYIYNYENSGYVINSIAKNGKNIYEKQNDSKKFRDVFQYDGLTFDFNNNGIFTVDGTFNTYSQPGGITISLYDVLTNELFQSNVYTVDIEQKTLALDSMYTRY